MNKLILIFFSFFCFLNLNADYLYIYPSFELKDYINKIESNKNFTINCGMRHCVSLKNGEVWVIGENTFGQLGTGDNNNRNDWTNTGIIAEEVKILNYYSTAIKKEGTLWLTGRNNYGQLGFGNTNDINNFTNTEIPIVNLNNQVAGGTFHSIIIKNGTVWSTGYNNYGQLGLGNTTNRSVWTNTNISADSVSCGSYSSYLLLNNTLKYTGINNNLNFTYALSSVKKIENGYDHVLALKNNNEVWGIGKNNYGQLGLGDNINRENFVYLNTYADDIEAGWDNSYLIKNGTIWSTGLGNRLGNGTSENVNSWINTGHFGSFINMSHNSTGLHYLSNGKRYFSGDNHYRIIGNSFPNILYLNPIEADLPN